MKFLKIIMVVLIASILSILVLRIFAVRSIYDKANACKTKEDVLKFMDSRKGDRVDGKAGNVESVLFLVSEPLSLIPASSIAIEWEFDGSGRVARTVISRVRDGP